MLSKLRMMLNFTLKRIGIAAAALVALCAALPAAEAKAATVLGLKPFTAVDSVKAWKWRDGYFGFDGKGVAKLAKLNLQPDYDSYCLAPGETITKVAQDTGLSVATLLSYNHVSSPRLLRPGQRLRIPAVDGVLVNLEQPTTVAALAQKYGIDPALIWRNNPISSADEPLEGEVFVPGARMDTTELRKALGEYFQWPTVGGRISSFFGSRSDPFTGAASFHTGVDIAIHYGAPVMAAGDGVVVYTGYNSVLGNHIRIDQGQGFVSVYGHLSRILTVPGARVKAGQLIGKVGSTGYSTGPHLHFTAYRYGRLLNPMALFG